MRNASNPYIEAHRSGSAIWIDMLYVPRELRGQGVGRRTYEEWEQRLPGDIETIHLMAADTGDGNSEGFWEAMGFHWRYASEDEDALGYAARHTMLKGVNGHPTPEPIWVDADEEE